MQSNISNCISTSSKVSRVASKVPSALFEIHDRIVFHQDLHVFGYDPSWSKVEMEDIFANLTLAGPCWFYYTDVEFLASALKVLNRQQRLL